MRTLLLLPLLHGCMLLGPSPFLTGSNAIDVAANRFGVCVVYEGGRMSCTEDRAPNRGTWLNIDSESGSTCGVRANGSIDCWGSDYSLDELGDPPDGVFVDVRVRDGHACAMSTDRRLTCWGDNDENQSTNTPDFAVYGFDTSGRTAAAIDDSGSLWFWGYDAGGDERSYAGRSPDVQFESVAFMNTDVCALDTTGTIWCWSNVEDPYSIAGGPYETLTGGHQEWSCALDAAGEADCWGGINDDYQQEVPAGYSFELIDAGYEDTCGWTTDDELLCWGSGDFAKWAR